MSESTRNLVSFKGFDWHDLVGVTEADLAWLRQKFDFHQLSLEDCLTDIQRPKLDDYDQYLFVILHFPVWSPRTRRIHTTEIDIFIGQKFVVTAHDGELKPLDTLRERYSTAAGQKELAGHGSGYLLYELTSQLFDYCFPILDNLWRTANRIEQEVFDTDTPQDLLREIILLKKNVITLRRILSPERSVISALERKNKKFLPADLEVYFDDIVDKIEKLWSSLDSLKEVADTLADANEGLIGHTTSNTIRMLTVFSVIMLPLTLITGFFGMNVALPHTSAAMIAVAMAALAVMMVVYFLWRRLL